MLQMHMCAQAVDNDDICVILNANHPEHKVVMERGLVCAQAGSDNNVLAASHQCGGPSHLGRGCAAVLGAGRVLPARVRVD